ncbi:MAG: DUF6475 domain-containing protein [Syntrophotalea acetylenica]|nr:DUF6475 domain-containing protein [Syntrophotalea acetylenica]
MKNTPEERGKFAHIMAALASNFSCEVSDLDMTVRWIGLRDYTLQQVEAAALQILRNRKFTKLPTVADFIEYIDGDTAAVAEIQSITVCRAIAEIGSYRSVQFPDKTTQAVIESMGGWPQVCRSLKQDNESWFRKEFAALYVAFAKRGLDSDIPLLGIADKKAEVIRIADALHRAANKGLAHSDKTGFLRDLQGLEMENSPKQIPCTESEN